MTVRRIVIPRLLPALPRGILGQFRPHLEDPADWVQRPQTDPHTKGVSSSFGTQTLLLKGPSDIFFSLQGVDGVEYLLVAVDASTLMAFLENEDGDWESEKCQREEQIPSPEPLNYTPPTDFTKQIRDWVKHSLKYRFVICKTHSLCLYLVFQASGGRKKAWFCCNILTVYLQECI